MTKYNVSGMGPAPAGQDHPGSPWNALQDAIWGAFRGQFAAALAKGLSARHDLADASVPMVTFHVQRKPISPETKQALNAVADQMRAARSRVVKP